MNNNIIKFSIKFSGFYAPSIQEFGYKYEPQHEYDSTFVTDIQLKIIGDVNNIAEKEFVVPIGTYNKRMVPIFFYKKEDIRFKIENEYERIGLCQYTSWCNNQEWHFEYDWFKPIEKGIVFILIKDEWVDVAEFNSKVVDAWKELERNQKEKTDEIRSGIKELKLSKEQISCIKGLSYRKIIDIFILVRKIRKHNVPTSVLKRAYKKGYALKYLNDCMEKYDVQHDEFEPFLKAIKICSID